MYDESVEGKNPLSFHINPSKKQAYFCCQGKVIAKKFEHKIFGIKGYGCFFTCLNEEVSLTLLQENPFAEERDAKAIKWKEENKAALEAEDQEGDAEEAG